MLEKTTPIPLPGVAAPESSGWRQVARRARPVLILIAAAGVPVAVAGGLVPVRGQLPPATVAFGLALVVSLVASIGNPISAAVVAVSAALSFDVLFTKPYGSLSIGSVQDIETTVLLLITAVTVGQLAARNRWHRRLAAQTGEDLRRIQAVAELMASGARADEVVSAVGDEIEGVLHLRTWRFEASVGEHRPGPTIERNGEVSWGRFWWGTETMGLPAKEITIVVDGEHVRPGRYVLLAEPGTRVTREQLMAAITLADQAGIAIGREAAAV